MVTVQALGFTDAACSDTALNEKSDAPTEDLGVNGVHEVNLMLDGPFAADDADSDGYADRVADGVPDADRVPDADGIADADSDSHPDADSFADRVSD
jgi:hypothetical protein